MQNQGKIALVTGASSGLGRAIAESLAAAGYRVYAGARTFITRPEAAPKGCIPIPLDVTSIESADEAVRRVMADGGRIDVLVQAAGMLRMCAAEETAPAEYRAVLETNFLGMTNVARAVLPIMRAQKQGRLILLSSLNGRFGIPYQSAYVASKHAVEGWAECLRAEMARFGITVTLIEPGDHRNGSSAYRLTASHPIDCYAADAASAIARIHHDESHGRDPAGVGKAVVRVLAKKRPPLRVIVANPDQRLAVLLHGLLPGRIFALIMERYYLGGR